MNEAQKLEQKGDKKLKSIFIFGNRYEEALDYFQRSLNLYRTLKQNKEALNVLEKVIICNKKLNNKFEMANNYVVGYQISNNVTYLESAIDIYSTIGKFHYCAKYAEQIAELTPTPDAFQKAVDFYTIDDSPKRFECLIKKGNCYALNHQFLEAVVAYESVLDYYLETKLLRHSVKDVLFRSMICYLASDNEDYENKLRQYIDMDVMFEDSNEAKLLLGIVQAINTQDIIQFQKLLRDYDNIKRFDNWQIQLLTMIKNKIKPILLDLT